MSVQISPALPNGSPAPASATDTDEESLTHPLLNSLSRSASNNTSQVAIVGSSVSPIESLDYEIMENDYFKQDWRRGEKIQILQYVSMKWMMCFFIGLLVGLVGFCNNLAVENIAGMKFVVTSDLMRARRYTLAFLVFASSNFGLTLFASLITAFIAPEAAGSGIPEVKAYLNGVDAPAISAAVSSNFSLKYTLAFLVFASSNFGLTLFASLITAFIAPEAAGSGIPEVKAYLNGVDAPAIFSLRTLFVKIIGSISAVSGSLVIGKAGPMVHTGACIAALMGQGGSKKYRLTWKWLKYFKNDRDRRDLVTCGSAAGMAAAFRAPVGGLLFGLEEMASWWRGALLWRAFFTTAVVAIVLRALIDVCLSGKCGLFGKGGLIMFDVTSANIAYRIWDVPPVLFLAVIGGIWGSLYNFLQDKVLRIYNRINERRAAYKIVLALTVSVFTSCLLFGLPWFAPCHPCPSDTSEPCPTVGRNGNYKKFQCPPGHYNDLASLFFNTNDDAIKNLFSKNTDAEFQPLSMLIFFITCFFLSIFSYGIVAPAGLFVPVIVTGAAYGRLIGMIFGSHSTLNHGLFAVLGSASLLGGSMRMTVSLCVIILELTNDLLLLPLMMIVLLISKTVADAFNGNIYDVIMRAKGFPYLERHAEPYLRQLAVSDVVTGPLQLFNGIEKVGNIVHVLKTTGHNGFPVVDEPPLSVAPVLFGLVLRTHLVTLLKKKAFLQNPVPAGYDAFKLFSADDFAKKGLDHGDKVEDLQLTNEEMDMFIDLHPFCNTSPYTVVETMSLAKALMLFREVGLRHLLVIPKISGSIPVVGIITRHDFMPEHVLSLHPSLAKSKWKRLRFKLPRGIKII